MASKVVRQLRHGQITIPKEFREALAIGPTDLLRMTLGDGKLEIVPVKVAPKDAEWAKRLYELFAPLRKSLEGYSEEEIDEAVRDAVKEARRESRSEH